tara:strand:- start:245 stop:592 length:348 start_codon:yes stop_codon:yes gene_type:complete
MPNTVEPKTPGKKIHVDEDDLETSSLEEGQIAGEYASTDDDESLLLDDDDESLAEDDESLGDDEGSPDLNDVLELFASTLATPEGDTVANALSNIAQTLENQNRILIKILSTLGR